ncbi:hypothetical protein Tco_1368533 [Tanacetum coccineum]
MLGGCWIPEFSEDEEDDDHIKEFISSEQSDLGLHIDGEDNGASEVKDDIQASNIPPVEREETGIVMLLKTNSTGSKEIQKLKYQRTGGLSSVKEEIVRFDKPPDQNAHIDMPFLEYFRLISKRPECMDLKEESKRAVWDAEQTNHRFQMVSHLFLSTLLVDY